MSADVIEIATKQSVDDAWDAFQKHAARSFNDRKLVLDRGYMERWALLEARFKKLAVMPRRFG